MFISILLAFSFQPLPFAQKTLARKSVHKVKILDHEIAVWWNKKTQKWNAIDNMCPHRQARLSSGVIHPNTCSLKCRYHGMEFDEDGNCVFIPSSGAA